MTTTRPIAGSSGRDRRRGGLRDAAAARPRRRRVAVAGVVVAIALTALAVQYVQARASVAGGGATRHLPAATYWEAAPAGATQTEMRHVDFHVDRDVVLHIRRLRGTMRSKTGGPVVFDDKRSFVIHITSAEVGLAAADLSALLNKYVFAYKGAPLHRLDVRTAGDQIVLRGRLRKSADLPFAITARLDVTPDGRIRVHPTKTVILGLKVDGLTRGLGLTLDKLVNLRNARGASALGNDIFLDPAAILPPPTIEGTLSAVRVEGDEVVQTFGAVAGAEATPLHVPDREAPNYMYYEGGTLRFGKLEMHDADMLIVDMSPADPLKFDLDHYTAQLVAGYSQTLPDLGLVVHMRDVDKVGVPRISAGDVDGRPPIPR